MSLSRSELLSLNKRRYCVVDLPTGGSLLGQSLTVAEMRSFRASLTDSSGELLPHRAEKLQELLVCRFLVDDDKQPMFTDDDACNGILDGLDGAVLATIYRQARYHTGFAVDDDFSQVEAAVKNSSNGQQLAADSR